MLMGSNKSSLPGLISWHHDDYCLCLIGDSSSYLKSVQLSKTRHPQDLPEVGPEFVGYGALKGKADPGHLLLLHVLHHVLL